MVTFKTYLRKQLKNKKFRHAYEALEPEYAMIRAILDRRLKKNLTQAALAKKMGTKQSAIARIEAGRANPSLAFMKKLAKALDAKLVVRFQ